MFVFEIVRWLLSHEPTSLTSTYANMQRHAMDFLQSPCTTTLMKDN